MDVGDKPGDQATIVIVDDSSTQRTILRNILEPKGYRVLAATDGAEGLRMVKKEWPDLVITDVEMPEMDGYELCRAIKGDEVVSIVPVIIVTSLTHSENLLKGIEAGADNYITKPYNSKQMLKKVKDLLSSRPNSESAEANNNQFLSIKGKEYDIRSSKEHILNFLLSTYENVRAQNHKLSELQRSVNKTNAQLTASQEQTERLLHNVFPTEVAESLRDHGHTEPRRYNDISVLFTDFVNFTNSTENLEAVELVKQLENYFDIYDRIIEKFGLEKIKTIGDSYMCAGGLPTSNKTHSVDCVLAGLAIQKSMESEHRNKQNWKVRIGIHTGPVVAGVIGNKRFAYDIWGNTVNIASRMESHGKPGAINISEETFYRVKDFFDCRDRGEINTKSLGWTNMYFVTGIRPELSQKGRGIVPNDLFEEKYQALM